MISRRKFLAGASVVTLGATAGCITANDDVVQNYQRGYDLYNTAEDPTVDTDPEESIERYEQAEQYFEAARQAANIGTVEEYCYEAREMARLKATGVDVPDSEDGSEDENDDSRYETIDNSDYAETVADYSRAREMQQFEVRSPSTVERRSRLPF